jgi:hypothetical protein
VQPRSPRACAVQPPVERHRRRSRWPARRPPEALARETEPALALRLAQVTLLAHVRLAARVVAVQAPAR